MREGGPYGKMNSSDRRRSSKWDSREESRNTFENIHDSGNSGLPNHDRESHELISRGAMAGNHSRWSAAEPLPGRRGSHRNDSIDEDRNRNIKGMSSLNEDDGYGTAMSPGLDDWRQQKEHRSPRNEHKRPKRSRSRSRSGSRSRSPIRGFGRDLGPNDRSRSRSGASAQVCKDYAAGWCRRGTHCHFLHGQTKEDSWQRQQKYPMPPNDRRSNDTRHGDASVEGHSNREPHRATAIPCKFFAAGHCRNGKNCRFSHEGQTYPSPEKSRDARVSVDDSKVASEQENWVGDMDMSPDWNYNVQTSKPVDEPASITNFSQNLIEQTTAPMLGAAVAMPSETPGSNTLSVTGSNAVGQGQIPFPSSGGFGNPQIQTMVQEEMTIRKPDIVEPTAPQFNSGVAVTPNNVSSEQLTTISASIAQLLANGQPLQQIYGSLVQNMMETATLNNAGPIKKDSAENTGPQKLYDPTSDSIEVEKHEVTNNPPGFSQAPSTEKNIDDEKPEVAAPATESRGNNNDNKQEHLELGSVGSKKNNGAPSKKTTKVEEPRDAKENDPSEKIDGEEKAEDGKKGKEAKGLKAFKFALVEFVKELLKPAWKEGQMSKDAYKNIVKKAVEKVTGTMQGANVPHTQEKIQQYLSASKPKLTKLVQAYVEKFQKDK